MKYLNRSAFLCGCLLLGLCARGEDTAILLSRADTAFAAGDYKTAYDIYMKLDGKLQDAEQAVGMRERLRVATHALATAKAADGAAPTTGPATQPANGSTGAARVPLEKPKDGETLAIGLHELGNFDFAEDRDTPLPDDVRALSGSKVRIPGQMMALDQSGKISRFILVNDLMSCCFGVAPKIQQVVYVQLPKGKWIEPTSERLTIEGTLKVDVRKEDGFVTSIFELEPTSIKYAPQ